MKTTGTGASSLIDTWILLRDIELGGECNCGMYILKSRGTAHSNQIREFIISDKGLDIQEVYIGQEGVLTGSMRLAQEAREKVAVTIRVLHSASAKKRELDMETPCNGSADYGA